MTYHRMDEIYHMTRKDKGKKEEEWYIEYKWRTHAREKKTEMRKGGEKSGISSERLKSVFNPSKAQISFSCTYIDHPDCITLFEVIQHRRFVEVGHHSHVLNFIKFGRIHGKDFIILYCYSLTKPERNKRRRNISQGTFRTGWVMYHE